MNAKELYDNCKNNTKPSKNLKTLHCKLLKTSKYFSFGEKKGREYDHQSCAYSSLGAVNGDNQLCSCMPAAGDVHNEET